MGNLYSPKRYKGYNIISVKELMARPDAIVTGYSESGKIVDLDPNKNVKPSRPPSGKNDSFTGDTRWHILVNIPPLVRTIKNEDGELEEKRFFTKVAAKVRMRWVSTDGKVWNRVFLFR